MNLTYATKIWRGEYPQSLMHHPKADLVICNNMDVKFVDIGQTEDYYYLPELEAVKQTKTKYLLWYASDVIPPENDWVQEAIPLLEKYPMVSPFWEDMYEDYIRTAEREDNGKFKITDFGFEDQFFSDQAYIAKTATMKKIDYNLSHSIAKFYPQHGGDSFEKRVAQWLARTGKKRAVLKGYRYRHLKEDEK